MPLPFRRAGLAGSLLVVFIASARAAEQTPTLPETGSPPRVVVTATRSPVEEDLAPAAVTTLRTADLAERQIDRVADALREVPGLDVVQTGAPGQLTSVFTRGLKSEHTQVLLDGIPLNQGLAGLFNFADLSTAGLDRIEVQRGPQSTLYGPRALAGTIQLFSARGAGAPTATVSAEGGSFGTFRERAAASLKLGDFDLLVAGQRLDTDNDRANNEYRSTQGLLNLGWTPRALDGRLRLGLLATASRDDTGNPGQAPIGRPRETAPGRDTDNLLTQRWLFAPNFEWKAADWLRLRGFVSFDREEQVNDPNNDFGFLPDPRNPTKAVFRRLQADLQADADVTRWLRVTAGFFYSRTKAEQYRPLYPFADANGVLQTYVFDRSEDVAGFVQLTLRPIQNLLIVLGGRVDHFDEFGTEWTGRIAASYRVAATGTVLRGSFASGFAPPTPQDRIFRSNVLDVLDPERSRGGDIGFEQPLAGGRVRFGANYFYNRLSNVIGFDGNFNTLNLGRARTQGAEVFARWEPLERLLLSATYTYLDARRTSSADISQDGDARLPRRARQQVTGAVSYRWWANRLAAGFEYRYVNAREELVFGASNRDIPSYGAGRVWLRAQVHPRLRLTARVENVFDRRYEEVPGYPALRRGFFGGAEWKF